jgi:hypothetical protein
MIRREYPNYTPEQVADHLSAALAVLEAIDPDDDDRPILLTKAIEMLSAKQIVMEQVQAGQFGLTVPRG